MSILPLRTEVHADPDGSIVVGLYGDIDMHTAPEVQEFVTAALGVGEPRIVVDLGGVTFMDSSGLTALVACQRAAAQHDAVISLRSLSKRVLDLLLLTGLDVVFRVDR